MVAKAFVAHQMPGRTRLKIPSKRGDVPYFESVVQGLAEHPAVDELKADPDTASVLIRHAGEVAAIVAMAAEGGLFELGRREASSAGDRRARAARVAVDAPSLDTAAVGLAGLGAYQVSRGKLLGTATENFWNAYGAYRVLKNPALAAGFVGLGLYQVIRGELFGSAASLFFYALLTHHIATERVSAAEASEPGAAERSGRGRPAKGPRPDRPRDGEDGSAKQSARGGPVRGARVTARSAP
jgi:hypothetical protein